MICWRYLHGEGFVASQLARTSGFWNFLAVTYIWISALEGAPPPDSLLQSHKPDFSLSLSLSLSPCLWVTLRATPLWMQPLNVPCHTYQSRVQLSPKSTLPHCVSVTNVRQRRKRQKLSFGPYSSCCMWNSMWSTQSGFHPQCPTLAEIQWIGSRPVTFNSLCRFYALPPVWPICSPENSLDVSAKAALNPIIRP